MMKSWIPHRSEPGKVSRDFWMPDQSCRVCYECDSQFTMFNRRHHCRLCGRVFCAKCTENTVPAPTDESNTSGEERERIRVCSYCFKQWEQGIAATDSDIHNETLVLNPGLSPSPSATSLASTKSSCTCNSSSSTVGSTPYSTGPYQQVQHSTGSGLSPCQSASMVSITFQPDNGISNRDTNPDSDVVDPPVNHFDFCMSRSDDEDDCCSLYHSDSEAKHAYLAGDCYNEVNVDDIDPEYGPEKGYTAGNDVDNNGKSCSPLLGTFHTTGDDINKVAREKDEPAHGHEFEAPRVEGKDVEPLDFDNNGLLWLPPEPEDEEEEKEAVMSDDDDDNDEGVSGEWGYLRSSKSFGIGEYRPREKSIEEHRKVMKNMVEGHFRALVSQLLQVENLPLGDENDKESWLEIITSLSWEAATLLKPDMSKGGGMDPGGYVKVKCLACGHRSESLVLKGVVCKKNVAHRRMTSRIDKPRFLILGGALEYQRVSNLLSSFDTLLQQEMDHLKMAVTKIEAHHPNVLLVEKSVSRYAQEYLLAKDISLVLNIKRPLLERIARCTGAQIVPSIDHLTSQKMGYCDTFRVEKFLEEHGCSGKDGKKLTKTLMVLEGCPKPLGCTILLKGANGDELKKVKHVMQYGVFAAYHLALETSFLADEGASLPELPLKSPITVALPDKPKSIDRSISNVSDYTIPATEKPPGPEPNCELQKYSKGLLVDRPLTTIITESNKLEESTCGYKLPIGRILCMKLDSRCIEPVSFFNTPSPIEQVFSGLHSGEISSYVTSQEINEVDTEEHVKTKMMNCQVPVVDDPLISNKLGTSEALEQIVGSIQDDASPSAQILVQDYNRSEEMTYPKEDFPPSPSDHQRILVFATTRCVWKGTVCEKAHLIRIKYYGSFDKPLGRFLRDNLFDQSSRCHSCEMPSEAHVHCYTHRQGTLTISVKKLQESVLPGEREGKIWMWHRCLRCPRIIGFPPATRRVVMSDAAWGLSFGKFLELSFSNHAAASRVASCGHSLHRDCLRFYGFGRMVACFHYASIDLHSVYLPPSKLDFNYDNQEWIQKEAIEVQGRAELLFTEVRNLLCQISEEVPIPHIEDLEWLLQKEQEEFKDKFQEVMNAEMKNHHPAVDILEINKLRRHILLHSYVWDQRLIYATSLNTTALEGSRSFIPKLNPVNSVDKLSEMNVDSSPVRGFDSSHSLCMESKSSKSNKNLIQREKAIQVPFGSYMSDKPDKLGTGKIVRRVLSDGHFPIMTNLSDTLDAAWTGKSPPASVVPREDGYLPLVDSTRVKIDTADTYSEPTIDQGKVEVAHFLGSVLHTMGSNNTDNFKNRVEMPFPNFYWWFSRNASLNAEKLDIGKYNPVYVSSFRELGWETGARLHLPVGVNDTVVPVYDDEPTSVISYVLSSPDYHYQLSESEKLVDRYSTAPLPLPDSVNLLSLHSSEETASDTCRSHDSTEGNSFSMSSRSSQVGDPLSDAKDLHVRVSFTDDGSLGKVKYTVTCYYAKRFEALRRICCPSELHFTRSLSRCKKWGAQGGKSNVFFAKTLDERFIIKQVTKTELESFIKFARSYFKYLSESIATGSPTCLAKILGIYQVSSKHVKGGKVSKMDVLVMENLLFRRNVTRLYDLKGSSRSRYNPDTSGSNKVLLDQNLIEAMPTSPIFVGNKPKRLLERAVWNDTSFLASIDVMDYSLLVGVDEEKHELVLGIIDFMRQYTWDKHLETWVKTSGILGGSKNTSPTVISPQQYKKRFRKAMTAYFLMVPDQWSSPMVFPIGSQSDLWEENSQVKPPLTESGLTLA